MNEGEIEVTIKIKEYLITQIDVENYRRKETVFKGKCKGKQVYRVPIAVKNEKYVMGAELINLVIDFSGNK